MVGECGHESPRWRCSSLRELLKVLEPMSLVCSIGFDYSATEKISPIEHVTRNLMRFASKWLGDKGT